MKIRFLFISFAAIVLGVSIIANSQAVVENEKEPKSKTPAYQDKRLPDAPPEVGDDLGKPKEPEYAPRQIIVKLKEGKTLNDLKELNSKYNVTSTEKVFKETASAQDTLQQLKTKLANLNAEHQGWYWQLDKNSKEYQDYIARITKEKENLQNQIQAQEELVTHLEQRQKRAPQGVTPPNLKNIYLFKTKEDTDISQMVADYQIDPAVEYAEPNYKFKVQMVPNDPYYSTSGSWGQSYDDLWGIKKIQCEQAWDTTQGEGVIVAVIDTGIDYNHEDFYRDENQNGQPDPGEQYNILINEDEIPNNGIDDDSNGYIDDVRGWDFAFCIRHLKQQP